ncbi:MAG: ABC transporter ATP-binding protein [Planctomycetes bacterium]|nr:ABC transporter ATP-binding protein [Planctomycetota bacterium]
MIHISDLVKTYGQVRALDHLQLDVAEGELFAYLGPNGAGKTTTIRILNGLTAKTSGAITIAGIDIDSSPVAVKKLCGLAAQYANLDGELTVAQNLDFHGRLYGQPRRERRQRAAELLDYVDLADRAGSPAKTLSGGLKRRLLLARALMHRPRLLFLDEPTAGLDPAIRRRIWSLVQKVRRDGVTVFLTTHYIEEAEFLATRVALLHRGSIAAEGTPASLMARLGEWAVDAYDDDGIATSYFPNRDEANAHVLAGGSQLTLRRINLEDAFIALTGKRVQ